MQKLEMTLAGIEELNQVRMAQARERVDQLIKPLHSLGRLEDLAVQLVGITGEMQPSVDKKAVIVMAGDHGVHEEGITDFPQSVTVSQSLNFAKSLTGVCVLGRVSDANIVPVDIGIHTDLPLNSGVIDRKIRYGTGNIAKGAAMTREEAVRSLEVGIEMAEEQIKEGVTLLGTGEMGICNTTPSSAILSVISGLPPEEITGRGAGVGSGGIAHKVAVIKQAIEVNQANKEDGIDVLAKLGGLEIGGMTGVMLGAARHRVPVVVDGFISTVAALIAITIEPKVKGYLIGSHASAEPGGKVASELAGVTPMIDMGLCLGEGSGAALAFPIIEAACSMLKFMPTFAEIGMEI